MSTQARIDHFQLAVDCFNKQDWSSTKQHVTEHLKIFPDHLESFKLAAFSEFQLKNYQPALDYLSRIVDLGRADAESFNLIGSIFLEAGDFQQSIDYFQKCIEVDPNYTNAYTNLSIVLEKLNLVDQAIELCETSLKISPNSPRIIERYTHLLFQNRQYDLAKQHYLKWISLEPDALQAHVNLVRCFLEEGDSKSAIKLFYDNKDKLPLVCLDIANEFLRYNLNTIAIELYEALLNNIHDKENLYNNIASAYDQNMQPKKAIEYFKQSIKQNTKYVPAYSNIGRVYTDLKDYKNAEHYLLEGLKLAPNNVNSLINIGRLYEQTQDYSAARGKLEHALNLDPNHATTHYNLANIYHHLGEHRLAYKHYSESFRIDPNYSDAGQNLGIIELGLGNFDTAWGNYFNRKRILDKDEQLSPITPGMNLAKKHVYFCRSQGIGDEIFFLRFLSKLKEQNVTISYRASKKCYPLLEGLDVIDNLLQEDAPIPECDYYFTIDDIPLILNINDVSKISDPLQLQPEATILSSVQEILKDYPPPYIGVTWRAGIIDIRTYDKDNQRSLSKNIPLDILTNILDGLDGTIVVLQRNPESEEIEVLKDTLKAPVIDLSAYNEKLDNMLGLLYCMDEYIGVSNTNTHLYAALAKEGKVLIPFPPDWRWMYDGNSTPWFKGFQIFRQSSNGDWSAAMTALKASLKTQFSNTTLP